MRCLSRLTRVHTLSTSDPIGFIIPPLPNALFTRDTTCWIYGGVTLNAMYWPARRQETLLTTAIYKFHPDFKGQVNVWWGDPTVDHGLATARGRRRDADRQWASC